MKSKFVKTVYEKNGFCIYVYVTEAESVPQAARSNYYKGPGYEFTAIRKICLQFKEDIRTHEIVEFNNNPHKF